jgi:inner membrane transporter RhtA
MPTAQPTGVALAVGAMATIQLGIALSEPLLHELGPAGVVTLRLFVAAAVLWPLTRPALRGRVRADLWAAIALGVCAAAQTLAFFAAMDRIPLGVAVAIEFLGPLSVGLAGSRRRLDALWVAAAAAGVALLTLGPGGSGLDAVGLALAGVAAVCWAGYIVLTKRVGARWSGLEGLAVALAVAAGLTLGPGVATAGAVLVDPAVLAAGAGLALLVPLAPFALEMLALRRLPAAVFGIVMSLEPALAALLGFALLGQRLGLAAVAAIGLILVASAGATLSSSRPGTSSAPASRRPGARRARRAGAAPARA